MNIENEILKLIKEVNKDVKRVKVECENKQLQLDIIKTYKAMFYEKVLEIYKKEKRKKTNEI